MEKKNNLSNFFKMYVKSVLFVFIFTLLFAIFWFYPYIYDFFIGDKIIEKHTEKIIGNESEINEVALKLINWHKENIDYPIESVKFLGFNLSHYGLYKIHNETKLFLRSNSASWVIKTKLARCGESAYYFVEIMDYLGYNVRIIRAEGRDHAWAEYYDNESNKIIVDPSANKIIIDKKELINNFNITKVTAYYMNGTEEDITLEYLGN